MAETLINSNQIRDGIGSKIKILNVVQTGTLTRDGAMFSGFAQNNYLQLGARVDKGILSLDSSTYTKNVGGFFSSSITKWEIVFKIKYIRNNTTNIQRLFTEQSHWSAVELRNEDNGVGLWIWYSGTSGEYISVANVLTENQFNWIKINFEDLGSSSYKYTISTSLDGITYTEQVSETKGYKLTNAIYRIGGFNNNSGQLDSLVDLEECHIKGENNEYFWKGVETI